MVQMYVLKQFKIKKSTKILVLFLLTLIYIYLEFLEPEFPLLLACETLGTLELFGDV
jgi:hypothetical protein